MAVVLVEKTTNLLKITDKLDHISTPHLTRLGNQTHNFSICKSYCDMIMASTATLKIMFLINSLCVICNQTKVFFVFVFNIYFGDILTTKETVSHIESVRVHIFKRPITDDLSKS
jgi:hypothetical protein